jgi:hypothetical protein
MGVSATEKRLVFLKPFPVKQLNAFQCLVTGQVPQAFHHYWDSQYQRPLHVTEPVSSVLYKVPIT